MHQYVHQPNSCRHQLVYLSISIKFQQQQSSTNHQGHPDLNMASRHHPTGNTTNSQVTVNHCHRMDSRRGTRYIHRLSGCTSFSRVTSFNLEEPFSDVTYVTFSSLLRSFIGTVPSWYAAFLSCDFLLQCRRLWSILSQGRRLS